MDNNRINDKGRIVVSIQCLVYNHGPYLRQCLDGFVSQETNFRFEAIVHDDASTDDSPSIIKEYAEKYPDIIKPILEKENQYSQSNHDGRLSRIIDPYCQGEFIAFCEGDDYWINPSKLQIQVDYLNAHPNCSMVFGNSVEHWENGEKPDRLFSQIEDRDYDPVEVSTGWSIPTSTVMIRRAVFETELYPTFLKDPKIITGDLPLWLTCATLGSLHGLPDVFSVYRRLPSGFMLKMKAEQRLAMGEHREEVYKVFGKRYKDSCLQMAMVHYRLALSYAKKEGNPKAYVKALWKSIIVRVKYPDIAINHILMILKQRKARLASN